MERSNCTLSLLALPKNFTFSLCVPLSVTRPPHNLWWCSFFFLRPPSTSSSLRWLSGYFLVFQLATWSAFRPFRGLSLKRSSNTSQRYGSPLLSSPSDPTYTCTQSSSEERSTGCSPRRHTHRRENPPFSLSSRRRKKLSPYRLLRGVSRERHRTLDCWTGNGIKDVRRRVSFIHHVSSSAWPDIPF